MKITGRVLERFGVSEGVEIAEDKLREARLAAARRNPSWTEIEPPVKRGRLYVDAASDAVLSPHRGVVFGAHSADVVAERAALLFTVSADDELRFFERQPGTWSQYVERQAKREHRRKNPQGIRIGAS